MSAALASVQAVVTLPHLLAIWFALILAAVLRAFTGFGFALAAVPVCSLFMPPTDALVLAAALTLTVNLRSLDKFWGVYPLRPLLPMLGLALLGTALGAAAVGTVTTRQFQLYLGVAVIAACIALSCYRPRVRRAGVALTGLTGLLSGLMNGTFAIPGPPVIIYAMATEAEPARSRALLMMFFMFSAVMALGSYLVAGFVSREALLFYGLGLPAMLLGDRLGFWLFKRYGTGMYRRIALAVMFVVGVSIALRALLT